MSRRSWTEYEDAWLKQVYPKTEIPIKAIAHGLGRTVDSVRGRVVVLRIKRPYNNPNDWTEYEDKWLRQVWPKTEIPTKAIAHGLGRTVSAVRARVFVLQIKRPHNHPNDWTEYEEAWLRRVYPNREIPILAIMHALGRSKSGIRHRASRLGIERYIGGEAANGQKLCSVCEETKPATREYFNADPRVPDGLHAWCIECTNKKATARRRGKRAAGLCGSPSCENPALHYFCKEHEERAGKINRRYSRRLHQKALKVISAASDPLAPHLRCIRCKEDDVRVLSINHRKGGGRKEFHVTKHPQAFYRSIVNGQRPVDDLEVLCCNCQRLDVKERNGGKEPQNPLRRRTIEILGGVCIACGETDIVVLQINHLEGSMVKDVKKYGGNLTFYKAVRDGNYDRSKLDVRCANCNVLYEYEIGRRESGEA